MPSPESPQNRTVAESSSRTGLLEVRVAIICAAGYGGRESFNAESLAAIHAAANRARLCGAKNGIGRCRKEKAGRRPRSWVARAGTALAGAVQKTSCLGRRQRDSSLTSPITTRPLSAGPWVGYRLRRTATDLAAAIEQCPQPTLFHRVRFTGITRGCPTVVDASFFRKALSASASSLTLTPQLLTHWVIVINTSTVRDRKPSVARWRPKRRPKNQRLVERVCSGAILRSSWNAKLIEVTRPCCH